MASWVPLFTPNPGDVIKDMDVVLDHCVLVARTAAGELTLIVVALTNPTEVYSVQVGVTESCTGLNIIKETICIDPEGAGIQMYLQCFYESVSAF